MFFFFFQAEDGIRDYKVTGVQTCALPILKSSTNRPAAILSAVLIAMVSTCCRTSGAQRTPGIVQPGAPGESSRTITADKRSEERRVGKECSTRKEQSTAKAKNNKDATDER